MGEARMRIVLADDDILLREGIASLLERAGFAVVGQAHDAPGLLALIREHRPDLAIVDIRMPPDHLTEGLDAARVIRQEFPAIGILVLSAHAEVEQAMELLATGQRVGYLLKSRVTDVGDFAETVGRIAMGGSVVDPALVQELITARRRDNLSHQLTEREREVLALMAEGRSNSGIAHRLWITEGTVEKHVRSILARMDLPETEDDHRRVLAVLAYLDSRLGPAPPRAARAREDAADRGTRQTRFGQERDRRAVRHHVREVVLGVHGNEDHEGQLRALLGSELAGDVKAVLLAEIDVNEGDIRLQLAAATACLGSGRHDVNDADPLAQEQLAGSQEEFMVVIDDEAPHGHDPSVQHAGVLGIAASRNVEPPSQPPFRLGASSEDGSCRGRQTGQRKKFTVARVSWTLAPGQADEHMAVPLVITGRRFTWVRYRSSWRPGGACQFGATSSRPNSCTC